MRCPKCGFISFDNVSKCLKCSKDISEATKAFQGSTLNVDTPSFLKIPLPTEGDMQIEGAAEVDGEIEFADPDLEILVNDGDQGTLDFDLEGDDEEDSGDTGSFEEVAEDDIELSADLGQFEDVSDDDTFSFEDFDDDDEQEDTAETDFAAMDMPEELSDISDLSPPEIAMDDESPAEATSDFDQVEEEEPQQAAEPEDDLDFSNLDFDLGTAEEAAAAGDEALDGQAIAAEFDELSPVAAASMDEDLDFSLDLGGLSIHDDRK